VLICQEERRGILILDRGLLFDEGAHPAGCRTGSVPTTKRIQAQFRLGYIIAYFEENS
jgi:hypothetical protein